MLTFYNNSLKKKKSWVRNIVSYGWISSDANQGVSHRLPMQSRGSTGTSSGWLFFPRKNR